MQKVTVSAKLVKVATMFQAVGDCRWYLNGFHLHPNRITATNGHVMWRHVFETQLDMEDDLIIKVNGRIPAKAAFVEFQITEEKEGIAICRDLFGKTVGAVVFEKVDGKYPDGEKQFAVLDSDKVSTSNIRLNAKYISLIEKACTALGVTQNAVMVNFHGDKKPMVVEINSHEFKTTALIMMMRKDEQS